MIEIYNRIIPVKGFNAMTVWPVMFVRKELKWHLTDRTRNHEAIHARQQKEMLLVLFLVWYLIEWLIKWAKYRDRMTAYLNLSFEREALAWEYDFDYLRRRKPFAWFKFVNIKK